MKYATIGTSWITQSFIDSANTVDGFDLAGVYSRDLKHAQEFAAQNGCDTAYDSLQALAQSEIDVVYIASPNSLHYEQAKRLLENGKHVVCEKPAVVYPAQLRELYALAKEKNVIFMEAIIMLHQPQFAAVREALSKIGPILSARIDYSQYSSRYQTYLDGENPNIFNPAFAGGCLMDLGVYVVYAALGLFGVPQQISTQAMLLQNGADISFCSVYRYADKLVTLTSSKAGESFLGSEIMGKKGTITFELVSNFTGVNVHFLKDGSVQQIAPDVPRTVLMANEIKDLIRYITQREASSEEYAFTQELALAVCETMQQMRAQAGIVFPE